jgi:hypothetical protein
MYRGGCALYLSAALAVLELWLTLLLPLGAAGILAAAERPLDGCAGMRCGSCWQLHVSNAHRLRLRHQPASASPHGMYIGNSHQFTT